MLSLAQPETPAFHNAQNHNNYTIPARSTGLDNICFFLDIQHKSSSRRLLECYRVITVYCSHRFPATRHSSGRDRHYTLLRERSVERKRGTSGVENESNDTLKTQKGKRGSHWGTYMKSTVGEKIIKSRKGGKTRKRETHRGALK
jgi:hypothetical protein